ncbi:ribosomal L7Ae/L30e/S12e/Gadd45 family protein [Alicyclobacillus sp. ALC3]|uniref:ribosomal L7Ae/L30e/S12e/Gadd45 family protein n=1 Tax=Alicyclobacillus sp. ALC3 TaxID=2796143 RepID=UPI0023785802|nr:ribosomal L7Ae/L30e/S12e/Gadd45 family protein [Alicyclobacillus sp. ALC3]WDL98946.1 ribosomal L7Ae/L30e/S12e/Gadd45 family protein [Alicyclobacillus sp. ALC3]
MSLDRIRLAGKKTIGANQTAKAVAQSIVTELFVAKDAEEHVIRPIVTTAQQKGIPVCWVDSMKQLGKACGIEVGAATAAILKD